MQHLDAQRRQSILDGINAAIENPLKHKTDFHRNGMFTSITPIGGILGITGFGIAAYALVCHILFFFYMFFLFFYQSGLQPTKSIILALAWHCAPIFFFLFLYFFCLFYFSCLVK